MRLSSLLFLAIGSLSLAACGDKGNAVEVDLRKSSAVLSSSSASLPVMDYSRSRQINASLGKGVNIGNALDALPKEGNWGVTIDSSWFHLIKNAGFQSVRIPVRWSNKVDSLGFILPNQTSFPNRVVEVVRQAVGAGLVVVVNIHHFWELTGLDNRVQKIPFEQGETQFLNLWRQIAPLLKDFPNDKLVFELFNEPGGDLTAEQYNQMIVKAMPIIRETNPERTVEIGVMSQGQWPGAFKLVLPQDNNLILAIHYYSPSTFVFQANGAGIVWGTANEVRGMADYFLDMSEKVKTMFPSTDGLGIPVDIGEFGCTQKADRNSRLKWTRNVRENAEANGFSFHYWQFTSDMGVYDQFGGGWDAELLAALVD